MCYKESLFGYSKYSKIHDRCKLVCQLNPTSIIMMCCAARHVNIDVLSLALDVYRSIDLSIYLSVDSVDLSVYLSMTSIYDLCLSMYLSTYLSACLAIHLSIFVSICLPKYTHMNLEKPLILHSFRHGAGTGARRTCKRKPRSKRPTAEMNGSWRFGVWDSICIYT